MLSLRGAHAVSKFSLVVSFLPRPVSLRKSFPSPDDAAEVSEKFAPSLAEQDADWLDSPMRSLEDSFFLLPFSSLSLSR